MVNSSIILLEKNLESRRNLYLAIGSTLAFSLYSVLILDSVSKCFRLEDSSNSLGLTFSYTLQMVQDFFETMPKLTHTVKVTNPNTGVESDVILEGLASFFG